MAQDQFLNKTYDQYNTEDFLYDQIPDNLNPRREVQFSQVDEVIEKLQILTNNIIRKQMAKPLPEEHYPAGLGSGEQLPGGIPPKKQILISDTGGLGNSLIFPVINDSNILGPLDTVIEYIIGTFPPVEGVLDELDEPPQIDCDSIIDNLNALREDLKERQAANNANKDNNNATEGGGKEDGDPDDGADENLEDDLSGNDDGEGDGDGSGSDEEDDDDLGEPEGDEDGDQDDTDYDDYESLHEMDECAQIELGWLKLILILVKILRIIKIIITLVLSILLPIIEIIRLACGAWLNPPNIAKIAQIIIQMVIAIILMILAMILQLIWDLLNFDCICDQIQSIMDQITKAMSAFSSIMNAFSPTAVGLMLDKIDKQILNPLGEVADQWAKNKEAWAKFGQDIKNTFSPEGMKKLKNSVMKDMAAQITTGVMTNPNIAKASVTVEKGKKMLSATVGAAQSFSNLRKAWGDEQNAANKSAKSMVKKSASIIAKAKGLVGIEVSPVPPT